MRSDSSLKGVSQASRQCCSNVVGASPFQGPMMLATVVGWTIGINWYWFGKRDSTHRSHAVRRAAWVDCSPSRQEVIDPKGTPEQVIYQQCVWRCVLLNLPLPFWTSRNKDLHMNVGIAHAIEAAESEYLCASVESLSRISGNPFGARVFFNEAFPCFQVKASPSPMLNRIYGDSTDRPKSLLSFLKESAEYSTVTPLTGKASTLEQYALVGEKRLERLRGWTHLQLACTIENVVLNHHSFEIEEATSQTLPEFAAVHASGFHTKPEHLQLSQASFAGLMSNERLKIYVLKADGKVVSGALMYLACNGVAYLGTAATRKNAQGQGYHGALISHRIEQAKKHGSLVIAATALPSSQSRRNLQRTGLATSHAQALYRLVES